MHILYVLPVFPSTHNIFLIQKILFFFTAHLKRFKLFFKKACWEITLSTEAVYCSHITKYKPNSNYFIRFLESFQHRHSIPGQLSSYLRMCSAADLPKVFGKIYIILFKFKLFLLYF